MLTLFHMSAPAASLKDPDVLNASEETDLPPLVLQYLLGQDAPNVLADDGQGGDYGTVITPGAYGQPNSGGLPRSNGAINTTVVGAGEASVLLPAGQSLHACM